MRHRVDGRAPRQGARIPVQPLRGRQPLGKVLGPIHAHFKGAEVESVRREGRAVRNDQTHIPRKTARQMHEKELILSQ